MVHGTDLLEIGLLDSEMEPNPRKVYCVGDGCHAVPNYEPGVMTGDHGRCPLQLGTC